MHEAAHASRGIPSELPPLYEPIRDPLAEVETVLDRELRSQFPEVDRIVHHGRGMGGKRLRPALLLLAAQATGEIAEAHHVLGAVVEMIHTATLIHDDVLDEATVRRHRATVNARWNNQTSVLLGDFLFTHAFYLASTLDDTFACRTIGQATNIVCEGELRQVAARDDFALSEDAYLSIIEAKTAELCACCCRLGAHYAGADAAVEESLSQYGRSLGIAFQIVDDLLDVTGDESTVGKSLGTDFKQRKPTLPLIRLLEHSPAEKRTRLMSALKSIDDAEAEQEVLLELERSEALPYTRRRAESYAVQATAALTDLEPSPALEVLRCLPSFVLARRH